MKAELSAKALKLVGNPNVLINLISRRVRQLSSGGNRPLSMETAGLSTAEIALTEIIEGKMEWETDLPKPKRKSRRRARKALRPRRHGRGRVLAELAQSLSGSAAHLPSSGSPRPPRPVAAPRPCARATSGRPRPDPPHPALS